MTTLILQLVLAAALLAAQSQIGTPAQAIKGVATGSVGGALEGGWISQASRSHGSRYLAVRAKRGTLVRICGPADCRLMRSTDYGPSSRIRPSRIADVALVVWEDICGLPPSRGLCEGTIEFVKSPALPATDTLP